MRCGNGTRDKFNKLRRGILRVMNSLAPVLFIGHGSPMNAITQSPFTQTLSDLARRLPKPTAICCVSAHWQTRGIYVLESPKPKTIHDFGGFPRDLYTVQYPANGSPEIAKNTADLLAEHDPHLTSEWGLDHGTWSVLCHMFPDANIPVYQISLDLSRSVAEHLLVAKELMDLRKKGVWILGSGNVVHNLGMLDWENPDSGFDWAHIFDAYVKEALLNDTPDKLVNFQQGGSEARLAVPTLDHYLPLIYMLGLRRPTDQISFPYEGFEYGGISMRAVLLEAS